MNIAEQINATGGIATPTEQKEIIDILLNTEKVDMATELNENEILPLSILEAYCKKPIASSNIDFQLELINDMIKNFKVNRVSLTRQSRKEIIEGWLGSQMQNIGMLKDKIGNIFKQGM